MAFVLRGLFYQCVKQNRKFLIFFFSWCLKICSKLSKMEHIQAIGSNTCRSLHNRISFNKRLITCLTEPLRINNIFFSLLFPNQTPIKILKMSQLMLLWYLSHRRPAKAQTSLHIRAVSSEPSLFAHMKYGSKRRI